MLQNDVTFYIEQHDNYLDSLKLCCRLLEKLYLNNHEVFIYTPSQAVTTTLDNLIWTFHDTSFIPHVIAPSKKYSSYSPIIISHDNYPATFSEILINLTNDVPSCFKSFKRIIEIICQNDKIKQYGRQKYRFYHNNTFNIKVYNL